MQNDYNAVLDAAQQYPFAVNALIFIAVMFLIVSLCLIPDAVWGKHISGEFTMETDETFETTNDKE